MNLNELVGKRLEFECVLRSSSSKMMRINNRTCYSMLYIVDDVKLVGCSENIIDSIGLNNPSSFKRKGLRKGNRLSFTATFALDKMGLPEFKRISDAKKL